MKKIFIFSLMFCLALGCKKEEKPHVDPQTSMEDTSIKYVSVDGKLLCPTHINNFGANYVASVYDSEAGYGLMYFDDFVTNIPEHAFEGCDRLLQIELPPRVDKICDYAFADCKNLNNVSFTSGSTLETIGKRAFENTSALVEFKFPHSIKSIDDYAFNGSGVKAFDISGAKSKVSLSEKIKGDNPPFFLIWVSTMDALEDYRNSYPGLINYLAPWVYDFSKIDGTNWTYYLPQGLTLRDLTIPCTHDAATWSAPYGIVYETEIKKDQNKKYHETYEWGARAFDLRLGINHDGDGNWNYYFVHGSTTYLSLCNKIKEDAPLFPSIDQLENSFLILFTKDDYGSHTERLLDCFSDLIEQLNEKVGYDYDRYIAYDDNLTLADCKGKIILFTREKDYLKYNRNPIYINYLTDEEIEVYRNATKVSNTSYPVMVQDEYQVDNVKDKIGYINGPLEDRIASGNRCFFINQFNATLWGNIPFVGDGYYYSWQVFEYVNPYMNKELNKDDLNPRYCQPLGVVYFDMCGVDEYMEVHETAFIHYPFDGDKLATTLWQHNFHLFWDVSWPKQ